MAAVFGSIHTLSHNILAVVENLTGRRSLQQIYAAQQGRLTGAGSADDGNNIALVHGEVNIFQNLMAAESLGKVAHFDYLIIHFCVLPSCDV